MAGHNFVKTGNYYVSKAGNDSSYPTAYGQPKDLATLQAQTMQCADKSLSNFVPKATIQAALSIVADFSNALGEIVIVGDGDYHEAISQFQCFQLVADGTVVLRGNGSNVILLNGGDRFYSFKGIKIEGYASINYSHPNAGGYVEFDNTEVHCEFKGTSIMSIRLRNGSKLINSSNVNGSNSFDIDGSIVFNSSLLRISNLKDSDVNSASTLSFTTGAPDYSGNNNYNNIRGTIIMNQNGAVSGAAVNGVGLTLVQHKSEYPTYNIRSFNLPPLFNDASKLDFTVQSTSPNINTGSTGLNHIGGVTYAKSFYSAIAAELLATVDSNSAYWENVTLQGNDFVVSPGQQVATIITKPIRVFDFETEIEKIGYIGLKAFNKSYAGGADQNKNVPDATTYPNSQPGGNPDRLTFYMRWNKQDASPVWDKTDQDNPAHLAQWANQNYTPAGTWVPFQWDAKPFIDGDGNGNGSMDFSTIGAAAVACTWAQLKIVVRNNYNA